MLCNTVIILPKEDTVIPIDINLVPTLKFNKLKLHVHVLNYNLIGNRLLKKTNKTHKTLVVHKIK